MPPSTSPVALILGAGPNIGQAVSRAFAAKGYRIALVARSVREEDSRPDELLIRADLSDPNSVAGIFAQVKTKLGLPHVVVYNASARHFNGKNPLEVSLSDFSHTFKINTTSLYAAAQQALLAFEELPSTASRTFIYTGNCTNLQPINSMLTGSVGKGASAQVIHIAAESYKDRGYKFYYVDERTATGAPVYSAIDGPAHGVHYTELAQGTSQGPWLQTFVKGAGYKAF